MLAVSSSQLKKKNFQQQVVLALTGLKNMMEVMLGTLPEVF